MDKYLFPGVFEKGDKHGYVVTFPDFPGCITEGDTLDEALHMAKDALEGHLYCMERDSITIPQPSVPEAVKAPTGGFVSILSIWMPPVRDAVANRSINKTLTLPRWLNDAAEHEKVNFSQVLQTALKEQLGISITNRKPF